MAVESPEQCKIQCESKWPGCNLFTFGKVKGRTPPFDGFCVGWKRQGCTLKHGKCPEVSGEEFTECSMYTNVQFNACGANEGHGACNRNEGNKGCEKGANWWDDETCTCFEGFVSSKKDCNCPTFNDYKVYPEGPTCALDACVGSTKCQGPGEKCVSKMVNGTATAVCECDADAPGSDGYIGPAHTDLHVRTPFKCYQKVTASTCEFKLGFIPDTGKTEILTYRKEVDSAEECVTACIKGSPDFPDFFTGCEHAKFTDVYGVRTCYMWTGSDCQIDTTDASKWCTPGDKNCTMVHGIVHEPFLGEWYANPDKCDEECTERGGEIKVNDTLRDCVRGEGDAMETFNRTECAQEDGVPGQPQVCKPENTKVCPPTWGNWTEPSECSIPKCGTTIGQKTRTRKCNYAYLAEGKPENGNWTVTYAGQNCDGPAMEVVEQCNATLTVNKTECSASFNSPDNPLIEAVEEAFTDGGAQGNALDNNLTTLWTSLNADGVSFNSDAALQIKFKVRFQYFYHY